MYMHIRHFSFYSFKQFYLERLSFHSARERLITTRRFHFVIQKTFMKVLLVEVVEVHDVTKARLIFYMSSETP